MAATILPLQAYAQSLSLPDSPSNTTASQSARDVLERVRPAVIQIKGFFGTNTAQAFHGSGFAVADGGVFMTNYHVVAQLVFHPGKYRLEYRTPDGKTGKLTVLAVDVRHDLALVRATSHAPAPLKIVSGVPIKGQRAYSVGFPLDVGLTITEGVSNGNVEDSFDPRIHYSGALNGGMSGGPALNGNGDVIGVNVSGYRFSQLVSFLVPAAHVVALRDQPPNAANDAAALMKAVNSQMQAHSAGLLQALDGPMSTQDSSGYLLPAKLAPFIDCAASGDPEPSKPVQITRISCAAKAGLHVQQGMSSGNIKYVHMILTTDKLDAWRFANRLSETTTVTGVFGQRKNVGPYACKKQIVQLKGFDASLVICARALRELGGLYDFTVRVSSLNRDKSGFTSHLDMWGLSFDGGTTFIRRFIDAMEWKP